MEVVVRVLGPSGAEIAKERWEMCLQCLAVWSDRLREALILMGREEQAQAHRDIAASGGRA